ncbi:MAG: hypothetical protein GX165_09380 [Firmicutes bacterium]|nr:hypothetical protein [Bacillota bacterium]
MAKLTPRERVMTTLAGGIPDRVPWIESGIDPVVAEKLLGRPVSVPPRMRMDPGLMEILNLDNISVNLKPPDVVERTFSGGVDYVGDGLIKGWDQLDFLMEQLPDPHDENLYKPISDYLKHHKRDYAAACGLRAGMANAYLSIGIETFSLMLYDDRKFVETVMDIFNDWTLAVVEHVNEMDFDYVIISDDLAHSAGPLFSPQIFRELFVPRYKRVVEKLKKPWILHTDGNFLPLIEDMLPLGMSAIGNLEPAAVDIVQLKKDYGHRVGLLGNIDLNYTLTRATGEEVEAQVKLRISQLAPGGRYLLASENSIPSYVRPENLLAMSRAVEKYGYY